jgi:UDP-N-acetylmuramoylalanine--D-glutamate ligase
VVSPGVPWNHPRLTEARRRGVPVWPELELGWRNVKPAKTVAVTGTNGKTTTTALVAHLLRTAGKKVVVGGNIGTPLSALAGRVRRSTHLVLEVSSYQLEGHQTFHPNVGLFLNLTPDHLARHGTMAGYARAKARLFALATPRDTAVLNAGDPWCRRVAKTVRARKAWFPSPRLERLAENIRLPGRHNRENAMAAAAAALALGISDRSIRMGMSTFKGVPHRIQIVATRGGVRFVNDSKSTNVDSTSVALKAFKEPLLLILGGQHKGAPYKPLAPLVRRNVREIFTIGEAAPLIRRDLRNAARVTPCGTLDRAVRAAAGKAAPGDVVLLSPACASFDQFRNFEHRGEEFVRLVRGLRA